MIAKSEFHHIGIAVFSIEDAKPYYLDAGYDVSETICEYTQKVKVAYARKEGSPTIELLEPLDNTSPVVNILNKNGCTPYHICYAVEDLGIALKEARLKGFMPLAKPVPGHGLGDALMVFLYNKNVGLIQLMEKHKNNERG